MKPMRRLLMPDCARVVKVLQAFLDGELDEDQAGMVAAHLESCDRCGIEAAVYEQVKEQLTAFHLEPDAAAVGRLRSFADDIGAEADEHPH